MIDVSSANRLDLIKTLVHNKMNVNAVSVKNWLKIFDTTVLTVDPHTMSPIRAASCEECCTFLADNGANLYVRDFVGIGLLARKKRAPFIVDRTFSRIMVSGDAFYNLATRALSEVIEVKENVFASIRAEKGNAAACTMTYNAFEACRDTNYLAWKCVSTLMQEKVFTLEHWQRCSFIDVIVSELDLFARGTDIPFGILSERAKKSVKTIIEILERFYPVVDNTQVWSKIHDVLMFTLEADKHCVDAHNAAWGWSFPVENLYQLRLYL